MAQNGLPPYTYTKVSGVGTIDGSGLYSSGAVSGIVQLKVTDALNQEVVVNGQVYSILNVSPTTSNITIANNQNFSASGGKTPYTFTKTSGVGEVTSLGLFSSNVAGNAQITISDALNQSVVVSITVSSNLVIQAGTCSYSVPEQVNCQVQSSGGVGNRSYSVNVGTINSATGVFKGACVNNLGQSIVSVTDEYNNSAQITLNYPCVYSSCNQIRAENLGVTNADYWIDLDGSNFGSEPFRVYCDITNSSGSGLTLISSGGSVCGAAGFTSKNYISLNGTCGYLPESLVRSLSQNSQQVTLRSGSTHTSYQEAKSSGSVTLNALRTGGNWNPGGSSGNFTEFVNTIGSWSWSYSCANLYVSSWPNMYQSCNNGSGVHWISATSGFVGQSNTSGASGASSTWLLTRYNKYPISCLDAKNKGVLNQQGNINSGVYTIDPDGFGFGNSHFDVYCDMETDGGGWTLVAYAGNISTNKSTTAGSSNFYPLFNVFGTYQVNALTTKTSFSRFDLLKPIATNNSRFLSRRTSNYNNQVSWKVANTNWFGGSTITPTSLASLVDGTAVDLRMTNTGNAGWVNKSNGFWTRGSAGSNTYPGISWNTATYENCDNDVCSGRTFSTALNRRSILYWESDNTSYPNQWFHASPLTLTGSTSPSNSTRDVEFYFRE